ncbi:MAG: DNA polymerase III subunit delta [Alphaproteobacteria bacterium]|nr:DNA polymerase III subunit delta [Alphaproteobacteria bacterium]
MEIKAGQAEAFLRGYAKKPDAAIRAVLLYGSDDGLVAERGKALALSICPELNDPFRVVDIGGDALKQDPARLADEFQSMSLMGGRRVVRVRPAGEECLAAVEALFEAPAGDALIILEAGNLAPAGLRKAVTNSEAGAAIGCYPDTEDALGSLVERVLGEFGLRADADTQEYLVDNLGGDRALSRSELEKLALYKGPAGEGASPEARTITIEDAMAVIGDTAAIGLDDVVDRTFDGDYLGMDRALDRVIGEGVRAPQIVRAVQRHADMLHRLGAAGSNIEGVYARIFPRPHFSRRATIMRQARAWPDTRMADALGLILEADMHCKTTGFPDEAIARRLCLRLAQAARGLQRKRA